MNRILAITLGKNAEELVRLYDLQNFLTEAPITAVQFYRSDKMGMPIDSADCNAMVKAAIEIIDTRIEHFSKQLERNLNEEKAEPPPVAPVKPARLGPIILPKDCKAVMGEEGWACSDCGETGQYAGTMPEPTCMRKLRAKWDCKKCGFPHNYGDACSRCKEPKPK